MDSPSPPPPKNQRRKRKDPESRDFICKCGKKYLSYAAAYTHVKNKHHGEKLYLDQIGRPQRTKLKRGRPKQRKQYEITLENQKLSIVQQAILCIYESFKKEDLETHRVILEGNQQFSTQNFQIAYKRLVSSFGDPAFSLLAEPKKVSQPVKLLSSFVSILTQHFLPNFAAKVVYYMNTIMKKGSNIEEVQQNNIFQIYFEQIREKINRQSFVNELWDGNRDIPTFIMDALEKWIFAGEKSLEEDQEKFINF